MNKTTNFFLGVIALSLVVIAIVAIAPGVANFSGTTNFNDLEVDSITNAGALTQTGAITLSATSTITGNWIYSTSTYGPVLKASSGNVCVRISLSANNNLATTTVTCP